MSPSAGTTAFNDQYRAAVRAARDALNRMSRVGYQLPLRVTDSPWLADQVRKLLDAYKVGAARTCPHLGHSPQVMHAAVWAPRTLVCSYCVGLIRPPTPIAEATCDRCGRLANYLHTGAVAIGPILLNYGLCTPCLTAARHTPATATRKDSK